MGVQPTPHQRRKAHQNSPKKIKERHSLFLFYDDTSYSVTHRNRANIPFFTIPDITKKRKARPNLFPKQSKDFRFNFTTFPKKVNAVISIEQERFSIECENVVL